MIFSELDHLRHSLSRQNWQQICDEEEPVLLSGGGFSGLDAAESDAFALVGAAAASIDQRRVEAVHVKVLIVDEKALAHGRVTVLIGADIESTHIIDN